MLLRKVVSVPLSRAAPLWTARAMSSAALQPTWGEKKKWEIFGGNDCWHYDGQGSELPEKWPNKKCEWNQITVVKDGEAPKGPQTYYPDMKYHLPYDTTTYRCGFIPEAYFNFLYERTGVLGPHILFWGLFIKGWADEFFILNEEFSAAIPFFVIPPYLAYKYGHKFDAKVREKFDTDHKTLEKLKTSKIEEFSNEADALIEDSSRADAGKEIFEAYVANVENTIEAEYRLRMVQVHDAFKRRLDYQVAVQGLEEQMVQKELVAYVKSEVNKALNAQSPKETVNQCIQDLKKIAAAPAS